MARASWTDGLRARVRRFLQRPGTADLRRARRLALAAGGREDAVASLGGLDAGPRRPFTDPELTEFCALGREAARRTLDQRPFDEQLHGVVGLLTGHVVEMATGEGKTLVGALAAAGYARQGRRVHVVSVNDYLARRDAEWMGPLYAALGVTVGWVGQHSDTVERRAAYGCDVAYVSVSEVGFDVLRDRLCTDADDVVLLEPDVVVVDEVDSVLIDQARVPLVLAGAAEGAAGDPAVTAAVAGLREGVHFEADADARNVHLTDRGLARIERALGGVDLYTTEHAERLTRVHVALHARALLHRDVDYLVRDGRVELIDDARGRVAHLQRWPDGLHAAVEAKEGLAASPTGEVLDRIVVQALIRRYRTVCGMSGTAVAVAEQLAEFYRLEAGAVPTHAPCVRVDEPDRLHGTVAAEESALVAHVAEVHAGGRPVLVGTQDVASSERLAAALGAAGVECAVLNARNDAEEAAIVAEAGLRGRVTISTQMAGRGTDIRLGPGVAALGGLHVVGCGRYESGRLDDQLRGRAGRQGDPGSSVFFTSLGDDLVTHHVPDAPAPPTDGPLHDAGTRETVEHAQRVAEGRALEARRTTWRYGTVDDEQRAVVLAHRDRVLGGEVRHLRDRCAERWAALRDAVGDAVLADAARRIVLAHLDRAWSDHLAFLDDVREGIHLRALARESPLDEFRRIAIGAFDSFFPDAYAAAAHTFATAEITADGVAHDGPRRPTATW
ncbi:MAG: accessory Sec system translocase SecA2, partial [Pseudonocardia sp.]|nr:accessory Sec system translocase SecA2 [Pseudonocardia sp.]